MARETAGGCPTDDPFAELVLWLAEDRARFDHDVKTAASDQDAAALAALRRQYAMSALVHVVQFLNHPKNVGRCPDLLRWNLDYHLRDLYGALQDLDDGRAPALLRAAPVKGGLAPGERLQGVCRGDRRDAAPRRGGVSASRRNDSGRV